MAILEGREIIVIIDETGDAKKGKKTDYVKRQYIGNFVSVVEELGIEYAVGIRSNHGVWLPIGQKVRVNRWRKFEHRRWDGKEETRYIREIIYGKRRIIQYWQITTDKTLVPEDSTWFVMTKIPNLSYKEVGEVYKIRSYEEQGFRNRQNELGWADFRLTKYGEIQKWWELVMCAYLMVCLHHEPFNPSITPVLETYQKHTLWDSGKGWKSAPPALRFPQRIGRSKQCLK